MATLHCHLLKCDPALKVAIRVALVLHKTSCKQKQNTGIYEALWHTMILITLTKSQIFKPMTLTSMSLSAGDSTL